MGSHFLYGRTASGEEAELRRDVLLWSRIWMVAVAMLMGGSASAQVTPAAPYTPPDDTPSIRIGMTLYPTFTYQTAPKITDADGNSVNRNSFDVTRAYLNITGNISHIVAFRITPDITRESGLLTLASGS